MITNSHFVLFFILWLGMYCNKFSIKSVFLFIKTKVKKKKNYIHKIYFRHKVHHYNNCLFLRCFGDIIHFSEQNAVAKITKINFMNK